MKIKHENETDSNFVFQPSPRPPFPLPGSTIANGRYFSLGKLGRGTFCEINKCVDLSYHHKQSTHHNHDNNGQMKKNTNTNNQSMRICAAKIELATFANSGVLDGEANVLQFLSKSMNNQTPFFCDYIQPGSNDNTTPTINGNTNDNNNNSNINGDNNNNKDIRAIIMEYLPGEDMHQLRDRHAQISTKKAAKLNATNSRNDKLPTTTTTAHTHRRLKISDAVFLCADVILPLLKSMHDCGMIHRDVKPSNCVRNGTDESDKTFKLVDFGLSKSFIVPQSSSYADDRYPWSKVWNKPASIDNDNNDLSLNNGCMRKERTSAEFRGTSMYSSLRVHQGFDHCRRDDLWGLMYVFCDLVSGGLPWMKQAANRDRSMCQLIKEWVHGERLTLDTDGDNDNVVSNENQISQNNDIEIDNRDDDQTFPNDNNNNNNHNVNTIGEHKKITNDRTEELLKGIDYHVSKYERDTIIKRLKHNNKTKKSLPPIINPLAMAKDETKVNALRIAFNHLSELKYADEPNYSLIEKCLKEFGEDLSEAVKKEDDILFPIDWKQPSQTDMDKRKWEMTQTLFFVDTDDLDPLIQANIDEAEHLQHTYLAQQGNVEGNGAETVETYLSKDSLNYSEIQDLKRLPLQLQFYLAQVEYNALNPSTIPIHLALRDWMHLASSLVNDEWDTATFERGNHRHNDDGFRRQVLMKISTQCLNAAKPFNNFCNRDCFYYEDSDDLSDIQSRKKRKIILNNDDALVVEISSGNSCFLAFSKTFIALKVLIESEKERLTAPPPVLSMR